MDGVFNIPLISGYTDVVAKNLQQVKESSFASGPTEQVQYEEQDLSFWKSAAQDSLLQHATWRFQVDLKELYICLESAIHSISLDGQAFKELAFFDFICTFWDVVLSRLKEALQTMPEVANTAKYHRFLHSKVTDLLITSTTGSQGRRKQTGSITLIWPWLCRTLSFFDHDPSSREAFRKVPCPSVFLESSK